MSTNRNKKRTKSKTRSRSNLKSRSISSSSILDDCKDFALSLDSKIGSHIFIKPNVCDFDVDSYQQTTEKISRFLKFKNVRQKSKSITEKTATFKPKSSLISNENNDDGKDNLKSLTVNNLKDGGSLEKKSSKNESKSKYTKSKSSISNNLKIESDKSSCSLVDTSHSNNDNKSKFKSKSSRLSQKSSSCEIIHLIKKRLLTRKSKNKSQLFQKKRFSNSNSNFQLVPSISSNVHSCATGRSDLPIVDTKKIIMQRQESQKLVNEKDDSNKSDEKESKYKVKSKKSKKSKTPKRREDPNNNKLNNKADSREVSKTKKSNDKKLDATDLQKVDSKKKEGLKQKLSNKETKSSSKPLNEERSVEIIPKMPLLMKKTSEKVPMIETKKKTKKLRSKSENRQVKSSKLKQSSDSKSDSKSDINSISDVISFPSNSTSSMKRSKL